MAKVKTAQQLEIDKAKRISETVAKRATYYRNNPQRFCKDYLNINLKLFQKILIYAMMHNYYFCFIACRGLGKTFLTALFCTVRAILFPGSKIVIASSTRAQGSQVLLKIQDELCKNFGWGSAMLRSEISDIHIGQNECSIDFKNGSWIRVAVASDSSRGLRGNVLVENCLVMQ